jgi:hypothetical protein
VREQRAPLGVAVEGETRGRLERPPSSRTATRRVGKMLADPFPRRALTTAAKSFYGCEGVSLFCRIPPPPWNWPLVCLPPFD